MKYLNEAGTFECIVIEPEAGWFGEAGEKQTPYIRIPLQVTEGEQAGAVIVYKGWLSNAAFDNTIVRLKEVFGFNGDLASLHLGKQTLVGKPCSIVTEIEDYNGKTRCNIAWLNPPGGGSPKKLDEDKVSSLLTRLNQKAKAIAKSVQGPPAAAAAPAATPKAPPIKDEGPDSEDDVPF